MDDLQALLVFGKFKVNERDKNGEIINPEERNIQELKEVVSYEGGKAHEQRWTEDQYITPKLHQIDEFINNSQETIDELNSHIRK